MEYIRGLDDKINLARLAYYLGRLEPEKNATNEEKASAPKDEELKEARRLMIIAQKNAFNAQKKFFIDKYGDDAYSEVKGM